MIHAAGVGRPLAGLIAAACVLLACGGCGPAGREECGLPRGADRPEADAGSATDLASRFGAGRWIDLTHAFGPDTIYWPTEQGFVLERVSAACAAGFL